MKSTLLFLSVFISANLFGQSRYIDCKTIEGMIINSTNDIPENYTGATKYCTKHFIILDNYQNGKLNGLSVKTSFRKKIVEFSNYTNGEINPTYRTEDLKGNLIESYVVNGKRDGEYIKFNKGALVRKGSFINGLKNGVWFEQGHFYTNTTYQRNGVAHPIGSVRSDSVLLNYYMDTVLSAFAYKGGVKIREFYNGGMNGLYQRTFFKNGELRSIDSNYVYKRYSDNQEKIKEISYDTLNNTKLREQEWTKKGVLGYDNNISGGYYKEYYKSGRLRLCLDFNSHTALIYWDVGPSKSVLLREGPFFYDAHNNVDRGNIMRYLGYVYNIGPHKFYAKSGSKNGEVLFSGSGRPIIYSQFDKNGKVKKTNINKTIHLAQDIKYDSVRKLYHSNKDSSLINGMVYSLYDNGNLKNEFYLTNGNRDGVYRTWYQNGQLKLSGTLNNGKVQGVRKNWYENGQLQFEIEYEQGIRNGIDKGWYENGLLEFEKTYKNGELIKSVYYD